MQRQVEILEVMILDDHQFSVNDQKPIVLRSCRILIVVCIKQFNTPMPSTTLHDRQFDANEASIVNVDAQYVIDLVKFVFAAKPEKLAVASTSNGSGDFRRLVDDDDVLPLATSEDGGAPTTTTIVEPLNLERLLNDVTKLQASFLAADTSSDVPIDTSPVFDDIESHVDVDDEPKRSLIGLVRGQTRTLEV